MGGRADGGGGVAPEADDADEVAARGAHAPRVREREAVAGQPTGRPARGRESVARARLSGERWWWLIFRNSNICLVNLGPD